MQHLKGSKYNNHMVTFVLEYVFSEIFQCWKLYNSKHKGKSELSDFCLLIYLNRYIIKEGLNCRIPCHLIYFVYYCTFLVLSECVHKKNTEQSLQKVSCKLYFRNQILRKILELVNPRYKTSHWKWLDLNKKLTSRWNTLEFTDFMETRFDTEAPQEYLIKWAIPSSDTQLPTCRPAGKLHFFFQFTQNDQWIVFFCFLSDKNKTNECEKSDLNFFSLPGLVMTVL